MSTTQTLSFREKWAKMSPKVIFCCFSLLVGDALFGYDTGSFGGILGNPGFISNFGTPNAAGKYQFSSTQTSLVSSLAFIGKFIGCAIAGSIIERWGHRKSFAFLSILSYCGVIVEMTSAGSSNGAGRLPQFIVGRIIVYISVGLVEVTIITYQAEIVPAPLRGLVILSLQLFLNAGSLFATGMNKAFSTFTSNTGWLAVTGIQLLFPTLLLIFVPFLADSPRWLLSKDRDADAMVQLKRLRVQADIDAGLCEEELVAIKDGLAAEVHKAPWIRCVQGTNLRRFLIVVIAFTFQQISGQAFTSTYQTVFYKTNGYADQAFTFPVINGVLGFLSVIPSMFLIDYVGRRKLLIASHSLQGIFMFILAGLGMKKGRNANESNFVVASFMLFSVSYSLGGASVPYLLAAEIPNAAVREKTAGIGAALNVFWAFVTNFSIPYMLAALSFEVGWIFGSTAFLGAVYYFAFLPETKGRALEEIDVIFEKPFNPFRQQRIYQNAAAVRMDGMEGEYTGQGDLTQDEKVGEIETIEGERTSLSSRV